MTPTVDKYLLYTSIGEKLQRVFDQRRIDERQETLEPRVTTDLSQGKAVLLLAGGR